MAAEPAHGAGGDRLSIVMADFFLDPAKRLTEQERALIGGLLDGLIGWFADEIRSVLPDRATAANDVDAHALRQILCGAGLLQRRDLMAILLRSADEERMASAVRARFPGSPALLQRLISSPDADVSAAAMELILARGRRRDRFGQPRLDFDDLPARVAGGLVHGVAAALRTMCFALGDDDADSQLAAAANALLGRRDEQKAIDRLTRALVETLSAAGLLDEALLESALREGDVRMVADSLALRASLGSAAAWDLLLSGTDGGTAMLLRMAGVSRRSAAELISAMGDQLGISDPARGIEAFDTLPDEQVRTTRAWMQLDPAFRAAAEGLGDHG